MLPSQLLIGIVCRKPHQGGIAAHHDQAVAGLHQQIIRVCELDHLQHLVIEQVQADHRRDPVAVGIGHRDTERGLVFAGCPIDTEDRIFVTADEGKGHILLAPEGPDVVFQIVAGRNQHVVDHLGVVDAELQGDAVQRPGESLVGVLAKGCVEVGRRGEKQKRLLRLAGHVLHVESDAADHRGVVVHLFLHQLLGKGADGEKEGDGQGHHRPQSDQRPRYQFRYPIAPHDQLRYFLQILKTMVLLFSPCGELNRQRICNAF